MTVELISVGTEILLGNIINTNAAWLAGQCAALGLSCYYQSTVGDNAARLCETLKTALGRSDAVILSGLSHPSIPEFLGVANSRRGYFFVLEYMPGDSLKTLLFQKHRVFSSQDIFQIGAQLLDILLYIHSRSVIHGDISISNVLYDGLQVSLIDFGLASYIGQEEFGKDLDYACFGNLLLYLLYSGYHGPKKGAWYEELPLSQGQKDFLKSLLGLKEKFSDTETVKKEFLQNFSL